MGEWMDERKEEKRKSRPTGLRSGGRTESEVRRGETRKMLPKTDRQREIEIEQGRNKQGRHGSASGRLSFVFDTDELSQARRRGAAAKLPTGPIN